MKETLILLGTVIIILLVSCKTDEPEIVNNLAPTCIIISPEDSTLYEIDDSISVSVNANDSDGVLAEVKFYVDNVEKITKTASPYTMTIKKGELKAGKHILSVAAKDDKGTVSKDSITISIAQPLTESPDFVSFTNGKIPYTWQNTGWKIGSPGYDDNNSIQGDIIYGTETVITVQKTFQKDGFMEFYDFGVNENIKKFFYIDNTPITPHYQQEIKKSLFKWNQRVYSISAGTHTFKWVSGISSFSFAAILDAINFSPIPVLASLSTTQVSNIKSNSIIAEGNVTFDGYSKVIMKGVCWSTSPNPTINNDKTTDGAGLGSFVSTVNGLNQGTTYYIRAYATNNAGTAYGMESSFTTKSASLPVLTTTTPTYNSNSAISGGNISSDGNLEITARGICWSTSSNPTINNNKTVDGTGTGTFVSNISNLNSHSTYYVRAYATNGIGTTYGNECVFTTPYFHIGQNYQGGIIAHIDETGQHGIIAAPNNQFAMEEIEDNQWKDWWYNNDKSKVVGTTCVYGKGMENTNQIVQSFGVGNYAAQICYDLELNGYNDWFLPSYNELLLLFDAQNKISNLNLPGYSNAIMFFYFTSSDSDSSYIYKSNCPSDVGLVRGYYFIVRACRYF